MKKLLSNTAKNKGAEMFAIVINYLYCNREFKYVLIISDNTTKNIPYPTAFPYGNGMVLHFHQQQESSTTKTVHKVINKGLKAYV